MFAISCVCRTSPKISPSSLCRYRRPLRCLPFLQEHLDIGRSIENRVPLSPSILVANFLSGCTLFCAVSNPALGIPVCSNMSVDTGCISFFLFPRTWRRHAPAHPVVQACVRASTYCLPVLVSTMTRQPPSSCGTPRSQTGFSQLVALPLKTTQCMAVSEVLSFCSPR